MNKIPPKEKLTAISNIVCDDIELLFDTLGVKLKRSNSHYYGKAICHGGNNHALQIYPDGHSVRGYWNCFSGNCHKVFQPTILGFTRCILSVNEYGWRCKDDKFVSFKHTLDFITKLYRINIDDIKIDPDEVEKRRFLRQTSWYMPQQQQYSLIAREQVRAKLSYPCDYFVKRGFSLEILDKYDIGLCIDKTKEMFGRAVIPVYDEEYKYMIGCTGRICYDPIPPNISKWKHSKNFRSSDFLFNFWFAKPHIKQSKTIILAESPLNVLRLEEAGIKNSVALFGCNLSDSQQFYLEKIGVMNVNLLMDSDDAGRNANEEITKQLKSFYNVRTLYIGVNDVADLSVSEVHQIISPFLA